MKQMYIFLSGIPLFNKEGDYIQLYTTTKK